MKPYGKRNGKKDGNVSQRKPGLVGNNAEILPPRCLFSATRKMQAKLHAFSSLQNDGIKVQRHTDHAAGITAGQEKQPAGSSPTEPAWGMFPVITQSQSQSKEMKAQAGRVAAKIAQAKGVRGVGGKSWKASWG